MYLGNKRFFNNSLSYQGLQTFIRTVVFINIFFCKKLEINFHEFGKNYLKKLDPKVKHCIINLKQNGKDRMSQGIRAVEYKVVMIRDHSNNTCQFFGTLLTPM